MDVAIAGGHGKIAMQLSKILVERGDRVVSLIRSSDQRGEIEELGAEPELCDLESAGAAELAEAVAGMDAVVFAAGAGPDSGPERKETVDHQGAVKLIDAAKAAGINRYVIISSMGANPDHEGDETFDVYLRAKGRADAALADSGLRHTIVRPGALTDDDPTGQVEVGESVERGEIPRADVAAALAACLNTEATIGQTIEVVAGSVPVEEAIGG